MLPPRVVDPKVNLLLDRETRAPRTDEYSIGIDRAVGRDVSLAVAFIHKRGANFIGDGYGGPIHRRRTDPGRRPQHCRQATGHDRDVAARPSFPVVERRQVFAGLQRHGDGRGKATLARLAGIRLLRTIAGLRPAALAREQRSGRADEHRLASATSVSGRDPNDVTNATGLLPNDRPHMLRGCSARTCRVPGW